MVSVSYKNNYYCVSLNQLYETSERYPGEPWRIGSVEFTEEEIQEHYNNHEFIVTSTAIYQIMYSQAQKSFYGNKLYTAYHGERLAGRGKYYVMKAAQANKLIGYNLFVDP